jgi:hypothetical protein
VRQSPPDGYAGGQAMVVTWLYVITVTRLCGCGMDDFSGITFFPNGDNKCWSN